MSEVRIAPSMAQAKPIGQGAGTKPPPVLKRKHFRLWTFNGSGVSAHFSEIWSRRKAHKYVCCVVKRAIAPYPLNTLLSHGVWEAVL